MRQFIGTALILRAMIGAILFVSKISAIEPANDPSLASVRIKSHGASGTIIATQEGRSWILGCAHMLEDGKGRPDPETRKRKIVMDGPAQPYAKKGLFATRLLAYDHALDLSLIEIDNGPFNYVPIAPLGHKPSNSIRSIGYDNMSWPVTNKAATILFSHGQTTYTVEKPWHGRSGGGLIDAQNRVLIGVVQGYETTNNKRGVYVSHTAVLKFMEHHWAKMPREPKGTLSPESRIRYGWEPKSYQPFISAPLPGCGT